MNTMEWGFSISDVANGAIVLILALLGALGVRKGISSGAAASEGKITQVAGALVDSSSVKGLMEAVENHTEESVRGRHAVQELNDSVEDLSKEVRELRAAVGRLGDIALQRG